VKNAPKPPRRLPKSLWVSQTVFGRQIILNYGNQIRYRRYEQLIAIIYQIPIDEVNKLKGEIERITSERKAEATDDLASLLASGP